MPLAAICNSTEDFAREQLLRLSILPVCGRCEGGKCEKCFNTGWIIDEQIPVTCSCPCWIGSPLIMALGVN